MKIDFYMLPMAERKEILAKIEQVHNTVKQLQEEYFRHLNRANEAKKFLDIHQQRLNDIRNQYNFD